MCLRSTSVSLIRRFYKSKIRGGVWKGYGGWVLPTVRCQPGVNGRSLGREDTEPLSTIFLSMYLNLSLPRLNLKSRHEMFGPLDLGKRT